MLECENSHLRTLNAPCDGVHDGKAVFSSVTVLRQESAFPQQALATGASPRRRWGLAGFRSFWLIFQHGPTAFRTICARAADDRIRAPRSTRKDALVRIKRPMIVRRSAAQPLTKQRRTSLCTHPQQAPVQLQQWRRALTVVPDPEGTDVRCGNYQ